MNQFQFEGFSSGPRYAQLAKTLLNEIHSKRYVVGDLLPTEFELCAQFGVSRFTVREAVKQLVQQGLVVRQPGVGSRVVAQAPSGQYTQTMSGITDLRQYANETTLHITEAKVLSINAEQALLLGATEGETWLHIQGLRYIEGQTLPICLTDVYVAPRFRSLTGVKGRMTQALYQLIEKQFACSIKTVQQELRAILLSTALAKRLDAPTRSAGLWISRRYMDERDDLVELAISVHPADRFSYREGFRREWQTTEQVA
jgi:DNA-binding GntR family transcriptional regulator